LLPPHLVLAAHGLARPAERHRDALAPAVPAMNLLLAGVLAWAAAIAAILWAWHKLAWRDEPDDDGDDGPGWGMGV
jgi:hypothetical protein